MLFVKISSAIFSWYFKVTMKVSKDREMEELPLRETNYQTPAISSLTSPFTRRTWRPSHHQGGTFFTPIFHSISVYRRSPRGLRTKNFHRKTSLREEAGGSILKTRDLNVSRVACCLSIRRRRKKNIRYPRASRLHIRRAKMHWRGAALQAQYAPALETCVCPRDVIAPFCRR